MNKRWREHRRSWPVNQQFSSAMANGPPMHHFVAALTVFWCAPQIVILYIYKMPRMLKLHRSIYLRNRFIFSVRRMQMKCADCGHTYLHPLSQRWHGSEGYTCVSVTFAELQQFTLLYYYSVRK